MSRPEVGAPSNAALASTIRGESEAARRAILTAQIAAPGEAHLSAVSERVARAVAQAEPASERSLVTERFRAMIAAGDFLPSVPILSNAGRGGQLAACFALELEDSLESIYGSLHRAARIQQGSGGVGIEFSALRPGGTPIERSGGRSPGPVAFAELFARSAHVMRMAGRRAGAHLAILRDDHPDLIEFIRARRDAPSRFPQLGFAVGLSDALLESARAAGTWTLRHARGGTQRIEARVLMHELAEAILASGNPTLLFVDRIQAENPTPGLGALRATNPCGEQPLLSGESCVLGSIQLPRFLDARGQLDESRLGGVVRDAIRLLDDALEVNAWPDAEIAEVSHRTRKVGLGVMGLADLLLMRGLPYDGEEARELCRRILARIAREADAASAVLGESRGVYPAWRSGPRRRNATTRALAPTGTLSLLAGCTPGIEPFVSPRLEVMTEDATLGWMDEWLRSWLADRGLATPALFDALDEHVASRWLPGVGEPERLLLRRAWEIAPEAQIAMQAAAQGEVDGAVSKTVQLDASAGPTAEDVVRWVELAHRLGCKGVAFYCHAAPAVRTRIDLRAARHPADDGRQES